MNIDKIIERLNKLDVISEGLHKLELYGDFTGNITNLGNPSVNFVFDNITECEDGLNKLLSEALRFKEFTRQTDELIYKELGSYAVELFPEWNFKEQYDLHQTPKFAAKVFIEQYASK